MQAPWRSADGQDGAGARGASRPRGCGRLPAVCAVLFLLATGPLPGAAAVPPAAAVVDFYAITPVPPVPGLIAERFAADDLSAMLAQAAAGRIGVIPRRTVERAERDLGWRDGDVLKYGRLAELARRLHADRLVVGWIRELVNSSPGSDGDFPRMGNGPIMGSAVLVVQVFDAAQGRLVAEAPGEGDAVGMVRSVITEQVLHRALAPMVGPLSSTLAAP